MFLSLTIDCPPLGTDSIAGDGTPLEEGRISSGLGPTSTVLFVSGWEDSFCSGFFYWRGDLSSFFRLSSIFYILPT